MPECNHNYCALIIACLAIFVVGIIVLATVSIINTRQNQIAAQKLLKYQIDVTSNIDKTIPETLDLVIMECFNDYKIKYLEPIEHGHINAEREAEIRTELVSIITGRISEATLNKLSLFYNINSIADILADKIYICVMNYVIEHNNHFLNIENK